MLVLEEPPISELDAWSDWFDSLKASRDELQARCCARLQRTPALRASPLTFTCCTQAWLDRLHIPALPLATLTARADQSMAPYLPRDDLVTLHGQSGGGI